jgi:peptide/nickel transport system substrate-binding protein
MFLGCAALMLVCVASAVSAADRDRVVNVASTSITSSFNFGDNIGMSEGISMGQVYDTLLYKDNNGRFNPCLADRWEISEDGIEYTFYLHEGVKWDDGVPFTAKDVEYTYNYLAKMPTFSWLYETNIDHMQVVDDLTIKIFLKKPNALFISMLATHNGLIMPLHGREKYGDEYGRALDKIIGTGPYVVKEWIPDVSITYEAKEDYFLGAPDLKKVVLHRITDTNAAIVALQTGELDIYFAPINGTAYATLSGNSDIVLGEYVSARNEGIYMYCKDGLFSDIRMRKAVAHAVNKEDYLMVGMDGLGETINYPGDVGDVITANPDFVPEITYEHDVEKARALVEEAGKVGASVVVKSYNTNPYAVLGTYIQGILNEIGLNATVEPMERATFLAQVNKEEVPILPLSWNGVAYDFEETMGISVYSANAGTAGNYSFYIDPEMDALVEAARAASSVDERKELYKKVVNKYMEEIPFVAIFAMKNAIPRRSDITTDNPKSYRMIDYSWVK